MSSVKISISRFQAFIPQNYTRCMFNVDPLSVSLPVLLPVRPDSVEFQPLKWSDLHNMDKFAGGLLFQSPRFTTSQILFG